MSDIHPNELAIIRDDVPQGETQRLRLYIDLDVHNERLLRRIAADRMVRGGFGGQDSDHLELPLHELAYEAIFGSNPDPLSPIQMGFEVIGIGHG